MDSSIVLGLEKENSGTSPTGHKEFDRDGYLVIEDIYDPDELYTTAFSLVVSAVALRIPSRSRRSTSLPTI